MEALLNPGRQRWHLYARVLHATLPARTYRQIYEHVGCTRDNAGRIVRYLHAAGLVHVVKDEGRRVGVLWAFGPGEDTAPPRPSVIRPRSEMIAFLSILEALRTPATLSEIAETTGTDRNSAGSLMRCLRALDLAHVADWQSRCGTPAALWRFALCQPDAPRPVPVPRRTVEKRSRDARRTRLQQVRVLHALHAIGAAA